jgi:hypothetical protein
MLALTKGRSAMADEKFGEPVSVEFKVTASSQKREIPALNWDISQETRRRIEELEENSRRAEQHLGTLLYA